MVAKRILLSLLIGGMVLSGCSQAGTAAKNPSEEAVITVLTHEFTGPDKEFIQIKEELQNKMIEQKTSVLQNDDPKLKEYNAYMNKTYEAYFSEKGYSRFKPFAFGYHFLGGEYEMEIKTSQLKKQTENPDTYAFVLEVDYQTDKGEEKEFEVIGTATVASEGKIEQLDIDEDEGLKLQIQKDSYQ
ncbi:hypothetical protein [Planococcus sp. YIM B11945]|uniref:hypothetical protein n=1 Tax=Planococcus sp. YIM B11945 TaxID=3435410 RepID=UPI003D7C7FCC